MPFHAMVDSEEHAIFMLLLILKNMYFHARVDSEEHAISNSFFTLYSLHTEASLKGKTSQDWEVTKQRLSVLVDSQRVRLSLTKQVPSLC